MRLRLIKEDGVSASFGLAADDALAQRVGTGESPPTLKLYTYSPNALVGRFQNPAHELHLDYCEAQSIPVNRRPTGGGAIVMGPDQLGIALILPGRKKDTYSHARELMATFAGGVVGALQALGVNAKFVRKNDIEVDGRKVAGLGIYRAADSGLLFHASILVGLDVAEMLRVLNTPFEKISDKEITAMSARISTVRRELGRKISVDEVRDEVAKAYAESLGAEIVPDELSEEEFTAIHKLEKEQYQNPAWTMRTSDVQDHVAVAKRKTDAGLLDIRAAMAGRTIKAVYICGDFFASDNAIADLENSLRWHSSDPPAVAKTLAEVFQRRESELNEIPLSELTETIQEAISLAEQNPPPAGDSNA